MSVAIAKAVNFGTSKGSLSTVGYTLKNADGTTALARTTSGITELVSTKGIYGGNISFSDTFSGFIIWDTGGATPVYAIEQFDYRNFGIGAGGGTVLVTNPLPGKTKTKEIWTEEEKDKVLKALSSLTESTREQIENVLTQIERVGINLNSASRQIQEKQIKISEFDSLFEVLKEKIEQVSKYAQDKKDIFAIDESINLLRARIEEYRLETQPIAEALETIVELEGIKMMLQEN